MMQLRELQSLFQRCVLEGRAGIEAELTGSSGDDFAARLGTYTEGYRIRLLVPLCTTYPGVRAGDGEAEFGRPMRQLNQAGPSSHYSVRYYGETVAEFIRATLSTTDAEALQD